MEVCLVQPNIPKINYMKVIFLISSFSCFIINSHSITIFLIYFYFNHSPHLLHPQLHFNLQQLHASLAIMVQFYKMKFQNYINHI